MAKTKQPTSVLFGYWHPPVRLKNIIQENTSWQHPPLESVFPRSKQPGIADIVFFFFKNVLLNCKLATWALCPCSCGFVCPLSLHLQMGDGPDHPFKALLLSDHFAGPPKQSIRSFSHQAIEALLGANSAADHKAKGSSPLANWACHWQPRVSHDKNPGAWTSV